MVRRDDDALFVKDGAPVKFCFHRSVTQGRSKITRDVEQHGGQIVANERSANVLLVDEQEDLDFLRRRYYSSTEFYRLCIYVEPRGFVQTCIRSGTYHHYGPIKKGMPGRVPGYGRRPRIAFIEEDRDHLAFYLATRCPTRDGRMGNSAYKDLERLGQTDDPTWVWAKRHTFHSWREHYKMNAGIMDARIEHYLERLKGVGHHFGHDPRSHDYRNLQQELAEEEEEDDEDEQWEGIEEQSTQINPAPRRRDEAAHGFLARHERGLVIFEDEDKDAQQEEEGDVPMQGPQRVKRHRVRPDARRELREVQAKKARVSGALSQASNDEAGSDESASVQEEGMDSQDSEDIEGSDLFGDRTHDESRFDFGDEQIDYPMPFSPRASPAREGPPSSTQATLIASPQRVEKEPAPTATEAHVPMSPPSPTIPTSTQQTLVMTDEQVVPARARGAVAVEAPTRLRPYSVESQAPPQQEHKDDKGKGRMEEEVLIEEVTSDEEVEDKSEDGQIGVVSTTGAVSAQDEMTVEGLLERSVEGSEDDEDDIMTELPRFQEIEIGVDPSDSDDAETHGSLVRGPVAEGSIGGESGSGQRQVEERVKRSAAPLPKTPSKATPHISPRRTRSATRAASAQPVGVNVRAQDKRE